MINFLEIYKGKYKKLLFTVLDADTNEAIDITLCTFKFTVKRSTRDADVNAVLVKASGDGISIIDGPTGRGQIDIIPGDTSNLPYIDQSVVWDLQIVRDSYPEILQTGNGKLLTPVTRAAS